MKHAITVVILNWLRPNNLRHKILPALETCPLVQEIIISHGRTDTRFSYQSRRGIRVVSRDDSKLNQKYGLSLRFLAATEASFSTILLVDDDAIPHPAGIINMYQAYQRKGPCIVGKYGRYVTGNLQYSSIPIPSDHLSAPITLTSLVMFPKILATGFFQETRPLLSWVRRNSTPYWNGEDIVLSLLSISLYQKWPVIIGCDRQCPVEKLRSQQDLAVAISQRPGHVKYRTQLIRKCLSLLGLHPAQVLTNQ